MASPSRRSLRERVLAVFGGKKPARHSCSCFHELRRRQRMDETGYPMPAASPTFIIQSSTLPSTSRPTTLTGQGSEQVQLTDRAKPHKSYSQGSLHPYTHSGNMWPFSRFQETLITHSELVRFPRMQIPTTESKNSSVRHKTKKLGVNVSVPNESTEENYSQMDTLCSEANRSSQMFDSSVGILDGNTASTTPITSGQSSKDPVEKGADQCPAGKTSYDRRSVGMQTEAVCDQDENPDAETRDLQLSHGAKTIIKTADAVIKIFDGSLSIKGRFKELVVQMNEKEVPRNIVVDVATSTDAYHTEHGSPLPQAAAQKGNFVDVGVGTSLTESFATSDVPEVRVEDTPSVQSELRRLNYKLLNSDDDDESGLEYNKSGLTVASNTPLKVSLPPAGKNISSFHPSASIVLGQSADELVTGDVRVNPVTILRKDVDCVYNTQGAECDTCNVSILPNILRIVNEHGQPEMQKNGGEWESSFVTVDSDVPAENINRLKTFLPCCSIEAPKFMSSCAGHVNCVESTGHSKEELLRTTNQQRKENDSEGNAERICSGNSECDKWDGTTINEDTPHSARKHLAHPVLSGDSSQEDPESADVEGGKRAECEGHSEGLELDECEMSAAADSSTIVDGCSPDSHPAECGTASHHNGTGAVVADETSARLDDGSGSGSGSLADECGLVDVYKLTQQVNHQTGKLNKLFDKYRSRILKVEHLQRYLEQLNKEKEEMCRLLQGVSKEMAALRQEAAELRCTVTAVCDASVTTIAKETDARRLEPTCYRRYTNIRTAADASSALAAVRCRIKALNELEVLVYRKQLMLNHVLPNLHQDTTQPTKPALLASKPLKCKKSEQTTHNRGSRNSVVIEVLSEPNSWSEIQTYTDSAMTISTALTTSNDGTASVGPPAGTDV